ncbi:hypothetical protein [Mesorhizobium sp. URHB0026]
MREPRCNVVLTYRADAGPVDVHHDIEELRELEDIVERGPDWRTLVDAVVTLNRHREPSLTVEQAEKL